jgi:phosphonate transport system substrate-binding protein
LKTSTFVVAAAILPTLALAEGPMSFGIAKPNGAAAAKKARSQIESYLSSAMGERVHVEAFDDYDALSTALAGGKVDLAWTTPVAFVKAMDTNGDVHAIVKAQRGGQAFYRAVLFVKKEAPAQSLEQLKGKKVAWVSKSSASGYIFAHALIMSAGEDSSRFFSSESFEGDHPAVCKAVREGRVDVGATFADPGSGDSGLRADGCEDSPPVDDFRVVASGGPIPNDVIATRPGFDQYMVEPVLGAFRRMSQSADGKKLLKDVFRVEDWVEVSDGDFQTVRVALNITSDLVPRSEPEKSAPTSEPAKKKAK